MRGLLLAALVACGHPAGGDDVDGGNGDDGSTDTPDGPPAVGQVTVHLVDKTGAPIPGLHVVFVDPDSTVTELVSDGAGMVQTTITENATLTAVRPSGTGCAYSMTTLLALVPGDDITLLSAPSSASNADDAFTQRIIPIDATSAGTFTINFTALGGAQNYRVITPCDAIDVPATTTSAPLTFARGCVASPMHIVVVATTSGGAPLKYIEKTNVAFAAGGSTTISDTWHDDPQLTASYTNTTTRVTSIEHERYGPYVRRFPMTSANGTPSGGAATLMFGGPTPGTATIKSRFLCANGSGPDCVSVMGGVAQQTITQTVDGTATTYALDAGANLLPWIHGVYNPSTTTMEVTTTDNAVVDLFEGNLRYFRAISNPACTNQITYTWRMFGPTPGNVTFPVLPMTTPGDPNVRITDVQGAYQLYLCESDAITGYRDAIKNVYEALNACESTPSLMAKPVRKGTINRLSQWN